LRHVKKLRDWRVRDWRVRALIAIRGRLRIAMGLGKKLILYITFLTNLDVLA